MDGTRMARMAVAVACAAAALGAAPVTAAERSRVRLVLDWKLEGPSAPFLLAQQRGYFEAEGLDVTVDPGNGSAGSVNRLAGGSYDLAVADLNALIDFDSKNPGQAMKAVYVLYNHPPYAVIALKKSGIAKPADLAGRKLGAPGFDGARKTWAAFAGHTHVPKGSVNWITMDPSQREAMLLSGQVDAIAGFNFTSVLDLERAGVRQDELVVFNYADHGVSLYGNAVVVSPAFAAAHPEQVKAFLRGLNRGIKAVLADPKAGVEAVKVRNPEAQDDLELARLKMALKQDVLTPEVVADGLGGVRAPRLEAAIDEVVAALGLPSRPAASAVFDAGFLPAKAERAVGR